MMKRTMVGALWGMVFYLVVHGIIRLIVGSPAADSWRPWAALVAAALASAGSWKGWLPGTQQTKD